MKKIGIIGTGRLGICFSLLLSKANYQLICSDADKEYIASLKKKFLNTFEPEVLKILKHKSSNKIDFTDSNFDVLNKSDFIFTFVPTPSKKDGSYDLKYLNKVINDLINHQKKTLNKHKTFIVGCTTNPGDCEKIQKKLSKYNINVMYSPEFIAQGSIIKDLKNADLVLLGTKLRTTDNAVKFFKKIYENIQINKPKFYSMSLSSAEVVKLSINCFLTTKVSFANFIGQILSNMGLEDEIKLVLQAIGDDTRVGNKYLKYGYGFGGPCLPRDNRSLGHFSSKMGIKNNLGLTVDKFNHDHVLFLEKFFLRKNKYKYPFYFPFLAYKKNTDIITESHALKLLLQLSKNNLKIYVKEKQVVVDQILNIYPNLSKKIIFIKQMKDLPKKHFKIDF